jgi:hypothetical protein
MSMPIEAVAVILCDDVRTEVSQKEILIGVYNQDVIVPAYPATLRCAVWIEYESAESGTHSLELRVLTPSGNPAPLIGFELTFLEAGTATFSFSGLPLRLEHDGEIVIQQKLAGADWVAIKRKQVRRSLPVGTAS